MTDVTTMPPKVIDAPKQDAAITPMQMLQIAVEKGADLDQLQKLMDLQERWEANQARKAYIVALAEFKRDPPTVTKNKKAGFESKRTDSRTEYEYATLAQVATIIAPALSAHGLSHSWSTAQDETGISVTCTLTHEMGHRESVTLRAPADTSGSKNVIQAIGSTVTYLQRYTLMAITGLAAEGQDDDGDGIVTFINAEQKAKLIALMQEVNADTSAFLRYMGIDYIDTLPAKRFDGAVAALEKKRKQGNG
jgi:hypothetical protein